VDLLMNELYPGKDLDVPDPWSGPEEEYHEAFKLIDGVCEKIIEKALQGSRIKEQETSDNGKS
jgi:protein-tyrosine phosphatase